MSNNYDKSWQRIRHELLQVLLRNVKSINNREVLLQVACSSNNCDMSWPFSLKPSLLNFTMLSNNYDKSWLYTIHDGNYQVAELSNNYDKSWLWKSTLSRSIS